MYNLEMPSPLHVVVPQSSASADPRPAQTLVLVLDVMVVMVIMMVVIVVLVTVELGVGQPAQRVVPVVTVIVLLVLVKVLGSGQSGLSMRVVSLIYIPLATDTSGTESGSVMSAGRSDSPENAGGAAPMSVHGLRAKISVVDGVRADASDVIVVPDGMRAGGVHSITADAGRVRRVVDDVAASETRNARVVCADSGVAVSSSVVRMVLLGGETLLLLLAFGDLGFVLGHLADCACQWVESLTTEESENLKQGKKGEGTRAVKHSGATGRWAMKGKSQGERRHPTHSSCPPSR